MDRLFLWIRPLDLTSGSLQKKGARMFALTSYTVSARKRKTGTPECGY